ncbi:hypothetical protein HanLR1_Chr00c1256g0798981 [Helianthus annuus]|nr:hypothetical protein HanLR1_Chr00c1256g0798981 [Helianthus annuus]
MQTDADEGSEVKAFMNQGATVDGKQISANDYAVKLMLMMASEKTSEAKRFFKEATFQGSIKL